MKTFMPPAWSSKIRLVLRRCPQLLARAKVVREWWRVLLRKVRWILLPRGKRSRDVVTLSTLGNHRFGNQFFQYVFIRTYATKHDLRFETTAWMGEKLFGHPPSRITRTLPELREKSEHGIDDTIIPHAETTFRNVDFRGYFQYHTSYYAPHKDEIHRLCQPVGQHAELAEEGLRRLRARGRTIVALHLRRSDFGYGYFFVAPSSWYRAWLETVWTTLDDPVLFLASESPESVVSDFAEYGPVTATDLGVRLDEFGFYMDFYLLTRCDLLAIANSTFSFAASMLNETASRFMRPVLQEQRLVPFDPWNSKPVLQDARVEDYPDIAGIAR